MGLNVKETEEAILKIFYEYGMAISKLGDEVLTWKQAARKQKKWIKENHKRLKKFDWYKG